LFSAIVSISIQVTTTLNVYDFFQASQDGIISNRRLFNAFAQSVNKLGVWKLPRHGQATLGVP
jgi:hypothetical protein